jgi:hypothetical protein
MSSADAGQAGGDRLGPWTVRTCVTAACTRCSAVPLDEDSGLTPHFASPEQARTEMISDWGWRVTVYSGWTDDELLCPPCAAAKGNPGSPPPADPGPDGEQEPGLPAWWEDPAQPRPELPPNAAVFPAPPVTREG